ncbi:hypothetical protein M406DRAFT_75165 [Cryphonectria parasitica EP155]|uniref:C3H1-type domain-containing protein n=1 Tax=Cryphonectria parasitica (strain ATCC 38755 / EP155) TaxID=660469 RepID=A0A9P5CNI0_CRYP1|nr:uncharacterized protein M406DRAFT_75165 [Cryphonectria parasitica EP155]KAF3763940.1 hypothetical protein M406DRAFT_75165 [Cryphonectria parasitica EP155]
MATRHDQVNREVKNISESLRKLVALNAVKQSYANLFQSYLRDVTKRVVPAPTRVNYQPAKNEGCRVPKIDNSQASERKCVSTAKTTINSLNASGGRFTRCDAKPHSTVDMHLLDATEADLASMDKISFVTLEPLATSRSDDEHVDAVDIWDIGPPSPTAEEVDDFSSLIKRTMSLSSGASSQTAPSPPPKPANAEKTNDTKPIAPRTIKPKDHSNNQVLICPYWVSAPLLGWTRLGCGHNGDHGLFVHRKIQGLPMEPLECAFHHQRKCRNGESCPLVHGPTLHGCIADLPKREPSKRDAAAGSKAGQGKAAGDQSKVRG